MRLLLMLLASSKVFPSLLVFLVISLPAKSTKLSLPSLDMYTSESSEAYRNDHDCQYQHVIFVCLYSILLYLSHEMTLIIKGALAQQ